MSEHISEDLAMILAALDEDDEERQSALAHAGSCPACARLVERGASVLSLIDAHDIDVTVDPQLKARVLASVERLETEQPGPRWEPYALAIGAMLSVVLALLDPHARHGLFPTRAPLCVAWQVLGALLCLGGVRLLARSWAAQASALRLAVVGMGGGLLGQLWLRARCPTHDALLHVLAFHVSGVVLVALLGSLFGRSPLQSRQ